MLQTAMPIGWAAPQIPYGQDHRLSPAFIAPGRTVSPIGTARGAVGHWISWRRSELSKVWQPYLKEVALLHLATPMTPKRGDNSGTRFAQHTQRMFWAASQEQSL